MPQTRSHRTKQTRHGLTQSEENSKDNQKSSSLSPGAEKAFHDLYPSTRFWPSLVAFWTDASPLSNWYTACPSYPYKVGPNLISDLLRRLDEQNIPHPPSSDARTKLLERFDAWNCGEHFMMACKAWMFEEWSPSNQQIFEKWEKSILSVGNDDDYDDHDHDHDDHGNKNTTSPKDTKNRHATALEKGEAHWSRIIRNLTANESTSSSSSSSSSSPSHHLQPPWLDLLQPSTFLLTLCTSISPDDPISAPRTQKRLGRSLPLTPAHLATWTAASRSVVTVGTLARAAVDADLKRIYMASRPRSGQSLAFVEGSPLDKIWGVGIRWDDARIEDRRRWKGENRLGVCHGMVRDIVLAEDGNV